MNILVCPLQRLPQTEPIYCPGCHSQDYCKHGVYTRKGFHLRSNIIPIPVSVQRYRCRNKECLRSTFSVLPPQVLRYCRFFWPCFLLVARAPIVENVPLSAWGISRGVALRAAVVFPAITAWVSELYREVTDGGTARDLGRMVKIIIHKIGHIELSNRWYRHRYPQRFFASL